MWHRAPISLMIWRIGYKKPVEGWRHEEHEGLATKTCTARENVFMLTKCYYNPCDI